MLFMLHRGLDSWADMLVSSTDLRKALKDAGVEVPLSSTEQQEQSLNRLEQNYRGFLREYLADPTTYRSGAMFKRQASIVGNMLKMIEDDPSAYDRMTEAQRRTAVWVEGYFGNTDFGRQNRRSLLNMNVTGGAQGLYAQNIMSAVTKQMNHYRNTTDMSEVEIFNLMMGTLGRRAPTTKPDATAPVTLTDAEDVSPTGKKYVSPTGYDRLWFDEEDRIERRDPSATQEQIQQQVDEQVAEATGKTVEEIQTNRQVLPDHLDQQARAIGPFTAAVDQQRQASRDAAYAQAMANPYPVGLNVPSGESPHQFLGFGTTGDVPGFEDRGTGYIDPVEFYHQITNAPPVRKWR